MKTLTLTDDQLVVLRAVLRLEYSDALDKANESEEDGNDEEAAADKEYALEVRDILRLVDTALT